MKKLNILSIVVIVCVALVLAVGGIYFYNAKSLKKNIDSQVVDNEVQKNKESNKDAINKAAEIRTKKVRPIDANDHRKGELNAPIQLIVYSDFECPFSLKFVDILKKTEEYFGDKIVIVFRHYPLLSHDNAVPAAIASECAGEQGKFWEMHDKLFQNAKDGDLSSNRFKEDAKDLGLDQAKFNQCLETEKYKDTIATSQIEAKEFGVNGTPASFINGDPLPGAVPFEDFTDSSGESRLGMRSLIESKLK